jgi:hypothetical protein
MDFSFSARSDGVPAHVHNDGFTQHGLRRVQEVDAAKKGHRRGVRTGGLHKADAAADASYSFCNFAYFSTRVFLPTRLKVTVTL